MSQIDNQLADVCAWAKNYQGPKFHALLCDPPYHLTTVNRFANGKPHAPGIFDRASRGFMGKEWDGGGVAFQSETWVALCAHLYDGAFGMAFGSSRGYHRLAVAIEDAGMVIHPSIFGWAFGSGFPKATRIDNQIDKAAGATQKVIGKKGLHKFNGTRADKNHGKYGLDKRTFEQADALYEPETELAKTWEGYRYGLQALKPALEPIIVFQKPYKSRPIDSIIQTGAGALQIDGARIRTDNNNVLTPRNNKVGDNGWKNSSGGYVEPSPLGRWPANFVLQHHSDCREQCVKDCPIELLGQQSGETQAGAYKGNGTKSGGIWNKSTGEPAGAEYGDQGTAARFFFNGDWQAELQEQIENADAVFYGPKASQNERSVGLENALDETTHPTVKPIALIRWLATLLLPPIQYQPRRLLVPFSGVASEIIGAHQAGWDEIQGVELMVEYTNIAQRRIRYWTLQGIQAPVIELKKETELAEPPTAIDNQIMQGRLL